MEINCVIIHFEKPSDSAGFFSNYFSVLSTMMMAVHGGYTPYVDSSNTWFNPTCDFENDKVEDVKVNPWNWWFEQPQTIEIPLYPTDLTVRRAPICRDSLTHDPASFPDQPNIDFARQVANRYCKVKPEILDKIHTLYKSGIEGVETLGVLARGTEMLYHHQEYPKVKPESWPDMIEEYLKTFPEIKNIFLVSDDIAVINFVKERFPGVMYLENVFRRVDQPEEALQDKHKPWWLTSPTGDPNHRRRVGEETLIQAALLSKCDYFLGSHSGIANGVQFFNNKNYKHCKIV